MSSRASVGGDERLRLFLALRLPDDVLDALVAWGAKALAGCRAEDGCRILPRDHLHVTLAFLGRRPAGELPAIVAALRGSIETLGGNGRGPIAFSFERWRETRAAGMLVLRDASRASSILADELHERLEALGVYRREARPWLPHVTMCRFRRAPRLRPPLPDVGTCVPSDAAAYVSHLHPTGARYEVLETVELTP